MRAHGRLEPVVDGDVLVSVSVGPHGEAVALWSGPDGRDRLLARRVHGGGATSARSRPSRPVAARVTTPAGVVAIDELDLAHCMVQSMPDGGVLVVGRRHRRSGPNAVVFDASGTPIRSGNLGDGIEHVLATPTGHVWVGYFDEGVYGDDPVAHHGIVRFTPALEPDWLYPFDTGFGVVDDCYALNVTGEAAWSCYYNGFPVVHIDDGQVAGWRNTLGGATALVVEPPLCALFGGYGEANRGRLTLGLLDDGEFRPERTTSLVLPHGNPLPPDAHLFGRGPDLHAFTGTSWHRLALDDLG
jgi:hypothetical protein